MIESTPRIITGTFAFTGFRESVTLNAANSGRILAGSTSIRPPRPADIDAPRHLAIRQQDVVERKVAMRDDRSTQHRITAR